MRSWRSLTAAFPLALWRDRVDVAHFQYLSPPIVPCPVVLSVHDISFETHPEFFAPIECARLRFTIPVAVRRAAHILTLSECSRVEIIEHYRVAPERISVTPLAAAATFRAVSDPGSLRPAATALGVTEPYILAVGNLQPRKNLERLLSAYAGLRRAGKTEHRLVLVGQKAYRSSAMLDRLRELDLQSHVTMTGYVTDQQLLALYNLADVFVYASLFEGFGLPILEAMACGTPVITSNLASMPEVAGDAAVLVDPLSEAEIGAAILRLTASPDVRRRMRERGIEHAAAFSWRRVAAETLAVYRKCA